MERIVLKLGITLIILSTLIISVGAGHGLAPLFLIQSWYIFSIPDISDTWRMPFLFFSLGQFSLIICLFTPFSRFANLFYYCGLALISCGILSFISIGMEEAGSFIVTLVTVIPFFFLVFGFSFVKTSFKDVRTNSLLDDL